MIRWLESADFSVIQAAMSGASVTSGKFSTLVVFSRELLQSTAAEPVVKDYLSRSAGLALDSGTLIFGLNRLDMATS